MRGGGGEDRQGEDTVYGQDSQGKEGELYFKKEQKEGKKNKQHRTTRKKYFTHILLLF